MFRHADQPRTAPIVRDPSVFGPASGASGLTLVDARVLDVLDTVARGLEKPQSVECIAARLRLSLSRFEHLFRSETGQAFKTFLRAARMTRAEKMLEDSTLRIKEVAAAVGYSDASNFSHDFRKRYGRSASRSRSPSL
jgi:AraC family transcriptional regulator of arabinose operon